MTRAPILLVLSIALSACGKSPAPADDAEVPATAAATPAAGKDACSLIDDPATLFGQPVTASKSTMPNQTHTCEWKTSDGRLCGMITAFGPGWSEVPDIQANYSG